MVATVTLDKFRRLTTPPHPKWYLSDGYVLPPRSRQTLLPSLTVPRHGTRKNDFCVVRHRHVNFSYMHIVLRHMFSSLHTDTMRVIHYHKKKLSTILCLLLHLAYYYWYLARIPRILPWYVQIGRTQCFFNNSMFMIYISYFFFFYLWGNDRQPRSFFHCTKVSRRIHDDDEPSFFSFCCHS